MPNVMIIDSDPIRGQKLTEALTARGLGAQHAQTLPDTAINADYLVALNNLIMDRLTVLAKSIPIIVIAEAGSIPEAVAAIHRGAQDYLDLPVEPDQLIASIERANSKALQSEDHAITQFPLIGGSKVMAELKANIGKVGPTDSTVVITGQSGTGKEVVARALHASSARSGAPMITVNCATVPANLIEAELFGLEQYDTLHEQGRGLVEAAAGGTLFLDEVADLPETAQARLLHVLNGENRRVGSSTTTPINVRIISATHRDLGELIAARQFREDLYYRISVFNFHLPPLHERQNDVLEIAQWVLARTTGRLNKTGLSFSSGAESAMLAYTWPGNIRELENAIERAVILSDANDTITQQALAIDLPSNASPPDKPHTLGELTSLEDYFVKFVQEHQDQLTETELAQKLGISRKSLWERRQRLNIPRRKTRKRGRRHDSASS